MVITPYDAMSHKELALVDKSWLAETSPTITSAERAVMIKPIAILVGVLGSFFFRANHPKIPTTTGVKTTTQNGLID
jgi:hypothetical protein